MNDRFDLHIITHDNSEVYCGYFRRLVFGNSLTFSHIPLCFHAKPPNFPRLFDPRVLAPVVSLIFDARGARTLFILLTSPNEILSLFLRLRYCICADHIFMELTLS